MQMTEVARFEVNGDVRRVLVGGEAGNIIIREDLSGPSVLVVFGDEERSLRMTLPAESLERLLGLVGFAGLEGSLWSLLSDERYGVVDLMDLCDREGVAYSFSALGSRSGLQFRPAALGSESAQLRGAGCSLC